MFTWMDEGMAENANSICEGESIGYDRITYIQDNSLFANGNVSLTLWNRRVENYSLVYAFFGYLRKQYTISMYKNIYSTTVYGKSNDTRDVDSIISGGLNLNFEKFVSSLQNSLSNFPFGFVPGGFSPPKGSGGLNLIPYTFAYKNSSFTDNLSLKYLDSSGGELAYNDGNAKAVVYFNNSSWTINNDGEWAGGSQTVTLGALQQSESFSSVIKASLSSERNINNIKMPIDIIINCDPNKSSLVPVKSGK